MHSSTLQGKSVALRDALGNDSLAGALGREGIMSADVSRHIRKEAIVNGVTNAFFNGIIAWFLLKDSGFMPFGGGAGIAVDIAATAAILLFIVALIVIPLNRRQVRKGTLPAFAWDQDKFLHRFWQRFPDGLLGKAFCFALLGIVVVAPVSYLPYLLLGIEGMDGRTYAIVKGIWAGIMAGIMVVPMIQQGMVAPRQEAT